MNRRIGIALILWGIGALIGSGYLVPDAEHKMDLGPSLIMQTENVINWWPYVAAVLCLAGIIFLLNSPDHNTRHYHHG
jgi:hypothetical protein